VLFGFSLRLHSFADTQDPRMFMHFPDADSAERVTMQAATNEILQLFRYRLAIGKGDDSFLDLSS
jgi:hypothetical protein